MLGAVCSAFLLIMSLVGFSRVDEAVGVPAAIFTRPPRRGLAISFVGGVIAVVGSVLTSREILSAGPVPAADMPAEAVEA